MTVWIRAFPSLKYAPELPCGLPIIQPSTHLCSHLPRSPALKKALLKPPMPFDHCETRSRPSTNFHPRYSSTSAPFSPLPRSNLTLHTPVLKSVAGGGTPFSVLLHFGTRSLWKTLSTLTSISRDPGRCHSRCTFVDNHHWIAFARRSSRI